MVDDLTATIVITVKENYRILGIFPANRNIRGGAIVFKRFNAQPIEVNDKIWYMEVYSEAHKEELIELATKMEQKLGVSITIFDRFQDPFWLRAHWSLGVEPTPFTWGWLLPY